MWAAGPVAAARGTGHQASSSLQRNQRKIGIRFQDSELSTVGAYQTLFGCLVVWVGWGAV